MEHTRKIAVALATVLTVGLSAGYGLAQGRPGMGPKGAMVGDAGTAQGPFCTYDGTNCPMHDLFALTEVKVEKTKAGAALQFSAKDPAKVAEVQSLAEKFALQLKAGACPMMGDRGDMHGHHHGKPTGK